MDISLLVGNEFCPSIVQGRHYQKRSQQAAGYSYPKTGIKVKTQSRKSEIQELDGKYIAFLKSPPEDGKANVELIKIATKYFGKAARIVMGKTSKNKVLEF